MKRILISLSIIGAVAAIATGVTIALFNDTETSTGNIFVAGSIDLKVDHVAQTYNDVDCETCSVNVFSSIATDVTAGTGAYPGTYPTPAVELTFIHPAWLPSIPGSTAKWIWVTNPVLAADTTNGAEYTFEKKFNWNGSVSGVTLDLALAADNGYKIVFNGTTIVDVLGTEHNYGALVDTTTYEPLMLSKVQNGENTLEITVRNKAGNSNPASNPAGLIFDLTVQRPSAECEADSAFQQACRLWTEKDLGQGDTFFNFEDVKPGDRGTNIISLHVFGNNAYSCLLVTNPVDNENVCVESETGDITCGGGPDQGELSDYLNAVVWEDNNSQNNQYDADETILYKGLLKDIKTMNRLSLTATSTAYIGLAWCLGTQTVDGVISCSGVGNQDISQTDSFLASLTAYAEQQRNNSGFNCASVVIPKD